MNSNISFILLSLKCNGSISFLCQSPLYSVLKLRLEQIMLHCILRFNIGIFELGSSGLTSKFFKNIENWDLLMLLYLNFSSFYNS